MIPDTPHPQIVFTPRSVAAFGQVSIAIGSDLAGHYLAVQPTGIVYVGPPCYLLQGREAGEIVDDTGAVVGRVFWPADGAVWIKGPGMELDWNAGSLDSNADGFVNGNDQDLWMEWWVWGSPMADWDGNGFVNADDFDSRAEAWQAGTK